MPQVREEFFDHPHHKTIVRAINEMESALGNLKRVAIDLDNVFREGPEKYFTMLEEEVFNESFLYEELGKTDARTVLGVFEAYKRLVLLLLDLVEEVPNE